MTTIWTRLGREFGLREANEPQQYVCAMVARLVNLKYIYFIKFCARGEDAVSISHHCANTNVVGKPLSKMRLTIKGILTTQLFLLGLLLMNSCGDNIKTGEMTLTPDDNSTQIVLKTKGQSVSGLNLLIKGEIQGSGQLGFGGNDSTFYKTYNLTEGKIEIKYHGDWYSEFCYVTYKPTTETKGKLMIEGDFIGD